MRARRLILEPGTPPRPLTCDLVAEAVVRAASITGELSILSFRDEAVLSGKVAFRARWLALAALLALHQEADPGQLGRWLGCGSTPLRSLARTRGATWWDEACVETLFVELAANDAADPFIARKAVLEAVAGVIREKHR